MEPDVIVPPSFWPERCRAYLATAPVRSFEPEGAPTWEHELFELTQRRGLPVVGDVTFGRNTPQGRIEPEPSPYAPNVQREPFGWSPTLGPLFLEIYDNHDRVVTRTTTVYYGWRSWLKALILKNAPPPPFWSERCRAYLATAAVRSFDPERATDWERELFELTRQRGLPVVGDVAFGRDTHTGLEPGFCHDGAAQLEPFARSPTFGSVFLERHGEEWRVVTRKNLVCLRWQNWLERLVLQTQIPAFPPPLALFNPPDLPFRKHFPLFLVDRLNLRQEEAASLEGDLSVFFSDTTFLIKEDKQNGPWQLHATGVGALRDALHILCEINVGWYFDTHAFAEVHSRHEVASVASANEYRRQTPWGELVVCLGPASVAQRIDLLGQPVEAAVARAERSTRQSERAPLLGSERLRRWARRRRLVRSPLRFDRQGLWAWADRYGVVVSRPELLLALEGEWGGLLGTGGKEPIDQPYLWFGVAAAEEAWKRTGIVHVKETRKPDFLSCGVEEPLQDDYPFWSWRDHRLLILGARERGEIFYEDTGAIWRSSPLGDDFQVAAGTARSFFERLALEDWLWENIGHWEPVRILAPAGREVAARLGLSQAAEASDWALTTYESEGTWAWQTTEYGPNHAEFRIVSEHVALLFDAMCAARELCPEMKIRLSSDDTRHRALEQKLLDAGFDGAETWYNASFVDFEDEQEPDDGSDESV